MLLDGSGIYAIENLLVPRVYVGATHAGFEQRRLAHFFCLARSRSLIPNQALRRDAERYGACAFRFVVLQVLPGDLNFAAFEQFWIDYMIRLGLDCYNVFPACDLGYQRRRRQALTSIVQVLRPSQTAVVPDQSISSEQVAEAYTVRQVAAALQVTTRTLRQCILDGKIRAFKVGGAWRISREEMQRKKGEPLP